MQKDANLAEIEMLKTEELEAPFSIDDENTSPPSEIESTETIVLPEIQSMTEYIRYHYEKEIFAELDQRIRCGKLGMVCKGRLLRNTDCAVPMSPLAANLLPKSGSIVWANYRRIAECCVQAELTVELEIEIASENNKQTVRQRYDVDMWFDMEDGIAGEYGGFRLHRCKNEDSGVKLDEYLVPVLKWEDVEEEAEKIIFQLVPEGLHDPSKLKPEAFAKRLGLKIVELPLYKRPRTSSILFFGAGEVQAASDESSNAESSVSVDVEANTIVLNSRMPEKRRDAIFHECFHFVEHRLFFQLQQMHNDDIARIGQWKPLSLQKNERSPVEWIEWQAHVGSQCLQVPCTLLRRRMTEELDGIHNLQLHMGYKLQVIGKKLAKEFNVWNYQLRNRMIQVGYAAAKGALNFVADDYIEPFAFAAGTCRGNQTFVVSPKEMLEEYVRNEAFRKIIDTGHYIYADGHICINDPEYVVLQGNKLRLTKWANAHVDQCCLRFVRTYHRDKRTHYVFGQLNSDEEYNGRSLAYSVENGAKDILKQAREISAVLQELPGSFSGTLKAHMARLNVTRGKLAEESMLSDSTIKRMRTGDRDLQLDYVIAICIGLHLQPEYSFDLIEKAGFRLRSTPEHLIYRSILQTMYREKLSTIQKLLKDSGCSELNLKDLCA